MTPRATMRLQLHKDFTFADASELVPYLVDLGISHVYSSPILTARAGSIHGYDVVDPTSVNPELGGEDGFRAFVAVLRAAGLGLIVDIVPNHMAVGGADMPRSSTSIGKLPIRSCVARCWPRSWVARMATHLMPGRSNSFNLRTGSL